MRRFIILSLLLTLILLPSCAPANRFSGGRPVTPSELESISADLFGVIDEPAQTQAPDLNKIVYWLPDGSVYHQSPDCSHLSGKRNIKESTLRTAESNGLRPCKDCGGK